MQIKSMIITGATSSLGCALMDECIKNNTRVLALVNPGSSNVKRIPESELITIKPCALSDMEKLKNEWTSAMGEYDALVHLAWGATHGEKDRGQLYPQVDNVTYTLKAIELAQTAGCKVFVGAGSQAEYGRTNERLTENTPTNPETPYGVAKLCAGQLGRIAAREAGIRFVWPRILSTYGPKYLPYTVVNYTINELLAGRKPSLSGGDQVWDFIYSADAAKALYLLAEKGHDGDVYVVGSGKERLLKEYLKDILNIIDPEGKTGLGLGEKPYTDTTVMHLSCDISKLREDTGFEPSVSFEDGIKMNIEWNRVNMKS